MNTVELTGRLTKDVELKTTSSGISVTTLTLAVKPDFVKKGEEPTPEFIPVTVWGSLADVFNENIYKGTMIIFKPKKHIHKNCPVA